MYFIDAKEFIGTWFADSILLDKYRLIMKLIWETAVSSNYAPSQMRPDVSGLKNSIN